MLKGEATFQLNRALSVQAIRAKSMKVESTFIVNFALVALGQAGGP
jgi:hypothetical protein